MTSHNRLGLLAAAVSDVPCLTKVTQSILERNGHFSLSSLRADSVSPEIFKQLKSIGQRTVALAPEAGSERLRKVINKHLTNDQLVEAVKIIAGTGNFTLRLYFLLGIPTETQKDVSEIVKLVKTMRHHMIKSSAKRGSIGAIKMSINCLVPKPFTPFQWFPMERLSILKEKQKWIKRALAKEGGIKVSFDVAKWAYVQTLLSVGDRRVGRMLAAAHTFEGNWKKAFSFSDINPDFFVYRPKELDEILPWDFIDHGISKKHLIRERGLALKATESEECHVGECSRCGVCNSHGKKHADR
jgi:radical SAM superfamily enzyme YgiQ (UPF0313 family)